MSEGSLISLASATSAASGGLLSCLMLYPLEMLKALMSMGDGKTVQQALEEVGGVQGLYKGVQYKCSQVVVAKFIYFYTYTTMQNRHKNLYSRAFTTSENLLAGYLGDIAVVPVALPIECVVTATQKAAKQKNGDKITLRDTLQKIHATKGVVGFYSGLRWQLVVSMLSAIQQTIFDQIRSVIIKGRTALSPREALLLGALARLIALTFVYPFMKLKTVVQAAEQSDNSASLLTTIQRNPLALYNGFAPEAVRGVLSSALLYLVKEQLHEVVMRAFQQVKR